MSLPPELHVQIAQQLIYPDALSLKHTSRYFYSFVDTGVRHKVDWLMSRSRLHLDCPNDTRCDLRSDLDFCRGSVPILINRRRKHVECESRPGLGCLIYNTITCAHRRSSRSRFCCHSAVNMWCFFLAFLPLVMFWLCTAEQRFFWQAAGAA